MKKVLFVATVVKTHIMEFHVPYLRMFKEMGWETAVAARNDYDHQDDCIIPYCDHYFNIPFERNPFKFQNIWAYRELKRIIDDNKYDIIHCHTPVGGALTRLAGRSARKENSVLVYTVHGFHFFHGASLIKWLLYYPLEKYLARFTDAIITINKEDYECAKRFKTPIVRYVHGVGIDTNKFYNSIDRIKIREKLGLQDMFVLLSVGELIPRKNHILVLNAISLMKESPEYKRIKYLICGDGVLKEKLKRQTELLGIGDRVQFLGYRDDIKDICNAADLFVFMSKQEGLPVALMEAMACKLPVVCSKIRGNTDLITDSENGRVIDNSSVILSQSIVELMKNPEMRKQYAEGAFKHVQKYALDVALTETYAVYHEVLCMKECK